MSHPRLASSLRVAAVATLLVTAQGAAPGCLRVQPGIEVDLALSWLDAEPDAWLSLGDGTTLRLEDGVAWIDRATLLRCPEERPRAALDALRPPDPFARWLVPVARAQHVHGGDGATIVGPMVLSRSDREAHFGTFTPSPGRYCGVHVVLASEVGPALAAAGVTDAGEPVSAWADEEGFAHVTLDEPLVLDHPGEVRLVATLFGSAPFAELSTLPEGASALGEHLLGGQCGGSLSVSAVPP